MQLLHISLYKLSILKDCNYDELINTNNNDTFFSILVQILCIKNFLKVFLCLSIFGAFLYFALQLLNTFPL